MHVKIVIQISYRAEPSQNQTLVDLCGLGLLLLSFVLVKTKRTSYKLFHIFYISSVESAYINPIII